MEDEDDLFVADQPLSEDEEEDSDSERKHQKLLEAVSSLDGKKRRRLAERTEAGLQVSEFGISSEGTGEKISLSDLIKPIKPSASLSKVKKQLNKLKDEKSVELPLSNEETQKIQRVISYNKAAEEVSKWDQIVKQNRRAEQLTFPLADETLKPASIEEKVAGWKPRTPLEMAIFNVLHKNKQPILDPLLTPKEEKSLKAMSLEEAKLRRSELQKARALQSYYEAKARRDRKIKSKKFHKLLKKGKQKGAIKDFEELRKTNPEAALEELEKLERTRMEERMSLKHQNSGKWAKSKAIMAKYDDESRKAMQEQLQRNKDLTKKIEVLSESEESEREEAAVPDFVNDAQGNSAGPNPWMTGRLRSDAKDSGSREKETQVEEEPSAKVEDQDEEEEQESEEEVLLKEFEDKRRWRKEQGEQESCDHQASNKQSDVAQDPNEKQVSQFNLLFNKLMEQNRKEEEEEKKHNQVSGPNEPLEGGSKEELEEEEEEEEEIPLLVEIVERKQSLEDIEALGQEETVEEVSTQLKVSRKKKSEENIEEPTEDKRAELIDHNDVLPVKAQKVRTPLVPITVEEEEEVDDDDDDDDSAQKMIIQEAFADDDVIGDFLNQKKAAEEAGKPKDINLVLPGWGEWGGTNLQVSQRKRKRFIIKASPAAPRQDRRLPNVIINEKRNVMAAAHQVNELPFPFSNRKHFESSIRAPIGKTWNTERAVQKLTSPQVVTKRGHIIEPITKDVFQKHAKGNKRDRHLNTPKRDLKGSRKRKL